MTRSNLENRLPKKIIHIVFVAVCCMMYVSGCSIDFPKKTKKAEAPVKDYSFTLERLDKKESVTFESLRGKPLFIDFWATWCPPCRLAAPNVEKLAKKYKEKLHVIGINLDTNTSSALKYIKENALKNIQLKGTGTDVSAKYGVRGIPAFFIFNSEGTLIKEYIGYRYDYYEEWVRVIGDLVEY